MKFRKNKAMKTFYRTTVTALCAMIMITACGNAGAQNNKKKDESSGKGKAVKELNYDQFNAKVYDIEADNLKYLGDKPAIVDFTASWCGPCQRIAPILEELAKEYADDIDIYKVDIDNNRRLAEYFNVSSIPAILYIPTGGADPVITVGARGKDKFKEEIKALLKVE